MHPTRRACDRPAPRDRARVARSAAWRRLSAAAAVLLGAAAACRPTLDIGSDDLDAGTDVAPPPDATLPDAAPPDDAPPDVLADAPLDIAPDLAPDERPPLDVPADEPPPDAPLSPTDAAGLACGNLVSCLNGQVSMPACLRGLANPLDAAQYAALYRGHAVTVLPGEILPGGTLPPSYGYLPESPAVVLSLAQQPAVRECLARARGCEQVLGCLDRTTRVVPCTPTGGAAPSTRCDGTVLRACVYTNVAARDGGSREGSSPVEVSVDCAAQGNACVRAVASSGAVTYGCAVSACAGEPTVCATSMVEACRETLRERFACPAGTACSATSVPPCRGATATACSEATFVPMCEGDTLRQCVGERVAPAPCPAGLSCQPRAAGAFCGYATECDPAAADTACNAATGEIASCALGRRVTIRCRADLRFASCVRTALGAVRCTP